MTPEVPLPLLTTIHWPSVVVRPRSFAISTTEGRHTRPVRASEGSPHLPSSNAVTGQMSRLMEHVGSVLRSDPFVRRWDAPSSQASCRFRNRRRGVASWAGGVGTRRALVSPRAADPPGRLRSLAPRRSRGSMQVVCTARLHSPTLSYMVTSPSPSSVRFEPRVLERLSAFVAAHRDLTLSSATSRLVDEALRIREHPLITFKDGPAGRRARLVGGPDVWEVIGAIRSVREAEPALAGDEVLEVAAETSGTPVPFIRAALAYWSDYPEEVDDFLDRARAEAAQAQAAWERQQGLLGL